MKSVLKKHKKDFSKLLRKIDAKDMGLVSNPGENIELISKNVDNECRKIRRGVVSKAEDLRITLDVLNRCTDDNSVENNHESLRIRINKTIGQLNTFAMHEMQEKLIPFNMKKGEWLLKDGRIEAALDTWEEVLKVNPDNEYIHLKLSGIMNVPEYVKNRALELHNKYQFKYLGSFGHNIAKYPICIAVSDYDNTLFVSDYVGDKILRFSPHGEYLGALSVEVKTPMGIFKGAKNGLWICDSGNSRLLGVDIAGNVFEEVRLRNVVGSAFTSIHPTVGGCLSDDIYYLFLGDVSHHNKKLITFNIQKPHDSLEVLPTEIFKLPNVAEFLNNRLYVCDYTQCDLFVYDAEQRHFDRLGFKGIPYPLYCFSGASDGLFLSAGNFILKVLLDGQLLFSANLSKFDNLDQATPLGLAVLKQKKNEILFVVDGSMACVHKFSI